MTKTTFICDKCKKELTSPEDISIPKGWSMIKLETNKNGDWFYNSNTIFICDECSEKAGLIHADNSKRGIADKVLNLFNKIKKGATYNA